MDTSKEYIEMCEKAVEIQKSWKAKEGDFYSALVPYGFTGRIETKKPSIYVFKFIEGVNNLEVCNKCGIWLPRQDQLQEILIKHLNLRLETSTTSIWLALNFARFCTPETGEGNTNVAIRKGSMEQLWLAYMMQEKYNKKWDGKDWK